MTYNKARNYLNNVGGSSNDLTDGQRRAVSALTILEGRCGFEEWFGDMEPRNKNSIFQELAEALES